MLIKLSLKTQLYAEMSIYFEFNILFLFGLSLRSVLPKTTPTGFRYGYMHTSLRAPYALLACLTFSFCLFQDASTPHVLLRRLYFWWHYPFSSHFGTNNDLFIFLSELLHNDSSNRDVYFSCGTPSTIICFTSVNIIAYISFCMDSDWLFSIRESPLPALQRCNRLTGQHEDPCVPVPGNVRRPRHLWMLRAEWVSE